jgi:hypothetical protein
VKHRATIARMVRPALAGARKAQGTAIRPRLRAPVSKLRQQDALQNARDDAFKWRVP